MRMRVTRLAGGSTSNEPDRPLLPPLPPGEGTGVARSSSFRPVHSGTTPVQRTGRLQGRGCLIVGGTGGIGLATARRFLEEGARVVVSGHAEASTREAID